MDNEPNLVNQPDNVAEDSSVDVVTPISVAPKKGKFSWLKKPNITWNRNTILATSLVAVLLLVGITTLILTKGNNAELSSEESVVVIDETDEVSLGVAIIVQEGTIQTKPIDSGDWVDATDETQISEGTAIRTVGATSRAVIAFDDGSALRLDANSEVELETVTTDRIVIKHISGYTYNRVLPSDSLTYVVTSTDAQYEALGTAFKTASTGDEQSVEVYQSSVVETNTNETPKSGEKLTVISKISPTDNGKIKNLDIEELKKDPFIQWNRELDEQDDNYKSSLGFLSDISAPELTLNTSDGEVVLLEPNATEGTIEISGNTESGAKVTVLSKSSSGAQPVEVTVGSDGNFTTPVLSAPIGDSVFEFTVKDRTGNTVTKTVRVTFQKKSQPVAGNEKALILELDGQNSTKIDFKWSLYGIEAPDGFKVVYEKNNPNPVYKSGDSNSKFTNNKKYSLEGADFTDGDGTYHVKVCIYDKKTDTCGQYSNNNSVSLPLL